jgi:SAM-dependent methyltransferase
MASRGKYAGVLDILQYNLRFYVASVCALAGIGLLLWMRVLPRVVEGMLIGAAVLIAFWSVSSLLTSFYIYDYAQVMRWDWLPRMLLFSPQRWANVHAGLDESTLKLRQLFPGTDSAVVDIYDAREMTEPSIARARQMHPATAVALSGKLNALPLADKACDTVFLLFAAHEIRQPARRMEFFREITRVLDGPGQVVLVEHLRDWKNFVAFGPGFLHFHSRSEWLRVVQAAGLEVAREESVTPFVRCFVMRRPDEIGPGRKTANLR